MHQCLPSGLTLLEMQDERLRRMPLTPNWLRPALVVANISSIHFE